MLDAIVVNDFLVYLSVNSFNSLSNLSSSSSSSSFSCFFITGGIDFDGIAALGGFFINEGLAFFTVSTDAVVFFGSDVFEIVEILD